MKTLKWIAYISAGLGLLLVILGSVVVTFHLHILQVRYMTSYFQGAHSFFLMAIMIFPQFILIATRRSKDPFNSLRSARP